MIEISKGGRVTDFDNMGAFPLATLGAGVGTIDTTGGCVVLGGRGGLFEGAGLASTPSDEET